MTSGQPSESSASQEATRIEGPPVDSDRQTEALSGDSAKSGEGTATEVAPPFRPMMVGAKRPSLSGLSGLPNLGERLDDFELVQILGEGAFGRVYLAKQISLGRQVALKVVANRGSEAQTLASLEHDHIIRVFAETVRDDWRLLCMQYVPGTNLDAILRRLAQPRREAGKTSESEEHSLASSPIPPVPRMWDGRAFLRAIDELSTQPAPLEPALLRDREFLSACDFVEVVCWIGGRLAEALDHAHRQGILHRDIKPANILFNGYGRPMLADFSLACPSLPQPGSTDSQAFGGTLSYMAAEHLDAFLSRDRAARQAVDERSDLYSLGIVLFEFLTGRLPHSAGKDESGLKKIMTLSAERRLSVPSADALIPNPSGAIKRPPIWRRRWKAAGNYARWKKNCRRADSSRAWPCRIRSSFSSCWRCFRISWEAW
jgi:serine/threonine protein kinase